MACPVGVTLALPVTVTFGPMAEVIARPVTLTTAAAATKMVDDASLACQRDKFSFSQKFHTSLFIHKFFICYQKS